VELSEDTSRATEASLQELSKGNSWWSLSLEAQGGRDDYESAGGDVLGCPGAYHSQSFTFLRFGMLWRKQHRSPSLLLPSTSSSTTSSPESFPDSVSL